MNTAKAQTEAPFFFAKGIGNEYIGGGDLIVNSIKIDASGNRYVTGSFYNTADFDPSAATANLISESGTTDIFIAKYNSSGNYVWAKAMGGTGVDKGVFLALDGSGNIVITGYFRGTADFDPSAATANLTSAGSDDIFVAKYNSSGEYVWAKVLGGTGIDQSSSLALDGSGNAVVTGYFNGTADFDPSAGAANLTSAGGNDIFVAKYNSSGEYVWAKAMGRTAADAGYSLALDGSGNVLVTGAFFGTVDFDPGAGTANLTSAGNTDIFLAKYNSSGEYVWANRMGDISNDMCNYITLDGSGNVLITGSFNSAVDFDPGAGTANLISGGGSDIFVAKYTSSGVYAWAKAMSGTENDSGYSLAIDGSGNVLVSGYFAGTADFDPSAGTANLTSAGDKDIFVAKYTSSGVYAWAKAVGGTGADVGYSLALDGSNVVVAGSFSSTVDFDPGAGTTNLVAGATNNGFIASYTASAGAFNSALLLGRHLTATNVSSRAIVKDGSGNLYVTGNFGGTVDFDPSAGTANLTSAGGNDVFVAKYTSSGVYVWAKSMGGTGDDYGISLAIDGSGNVVVTGYFNGTADFDPGAGTANLTSAGNTDIFVAKYTSSGVYVWAKAMGGTAGDTPFSLALDGSGNVVVTGNFNGTADFDPSAVTVNLVSAGSNDVFVAKYNSSGEYVWANRMGGTNTDQSMSLALDGNGNLYVTGYFNATVDFDPSTGTANLTSAGSFDIFVAKYDASGNYVWANRMGGTNVDQGNSLILDGSGNVLVSGYLIGTADFDPSAGTANLTSAGSQDIFVAKYTSSGEYVWAKGMGGINSDTPYSLASDGNGNVLVTGNFAGTVDFDPGAGTANLISAGAGDIFVAKYTSSGEYVWAKGMGGTGSDGGLSLVIDGSGKILVTGFFSATVDFDPTVNTSNLTSMSGGQYSFIAAYFNCSNPTVGGTIAAAQSGNTPFNPVAFTSSVAASGHTGTLEYKWQSSTTSNSAGFSDIAASNAATYDAGDLTQTTWFKRLARVDCATDWNNAAESNVIEVTVITLAAPTAADQTFCGSKTVADLVATGTDLQWYDVATGGTALATGTALASGTYYVSQTVSGTESDRTTVVVTVNTPTTSSQTVSQCGAYTWTVNGQNYTQSGTYTETIANAAGCDSTITLNLTIKDATASSEIVSQCGAYTWAVNGQNYTQSGIYTETIANAAGCDSTITLNLTIKDATSSSETVSQCGPYTWAVNGQNYTQSGTYTEVIANAAGCDSTITLNLTIKDATSSSETVSQCGPYTWAVNGLNYTQSGVYTETIANAAGCDSTITLNLTIKDATSSSETVSQCGPYTWAVNGLNYTQSGVYTETIANAAGCDSTITLNLTIKDATSSSETVSQCGAYIWAVNGQNYTQSGIYTETIANAAGCDSTITLNLTIKDATSSSETVSQCGAYTWAVNGMNYTQSGIYTEVIANAAGCDSTITLNLTIKDATSSSETVSQCGAYTWAVNGQNYTQSGIYTETIANAAGCDSTITLNLTIKDATSSSETVSHCGAYTWAVNGLNYTQSGVYTETIANAAGCDSTITLNLTVNEIPSSGTISGANAVCIGGTINLTPSITGGTWTTSTPTIATVTNGAVNGVAAGTATISYTVVSGFCSSTCTKLMTVEAVPVVTINGSNKICKGGRAMMKASIAGGVWGVENSALMVTSSQGLFRNPSTPATDNFLSGVNYTLKSKLGACTTKVVKNVYIRNVASPSITVTAPKTGLTVNETVTATAATSLAATGVWSSMTSIVSATRNTSNTKTAAIKGLKVGTINANVVYYADDAATGCRQLNWLTFTVTAASSMVDVASSRTSHTNSVHIYPNPSNGKFTIENIDGATSVKLVDLSGRVIATQSIAIGTTTVDFSGVATGKYMVNISGDNFNEVQSVVIE